MFNHEKLTVYQEAISFVTEANDVLKKVPRSLSVRDQLERASTSIPLNIAEGNGKFGEKDKCRFFDIARGSTMECAACLDVLSAKGLFEPNDLLPLKHRLNTIVSLLVGLIRSTSRERTY